MSTVVAPGLPALTFVDHDRTFTCTVGPRLASEGTLWWWFSVSGGNTSRYAPFIASADDTARSVRERIVTYYDEHLARRAAPSGPHWRRDRR